MITKAGKVMTKKFLFISSFFYLAAAALPMTEARAADPDTDPVNITCPGGSCDNQTIDNNGEMTVNAEGVAKENTIGDTGKMTVNDGGIAQKTTVNSGGSVQINEGGSAIETTINGGLMNVAETGTAEGVTIDSGALLSGGYVSEAVVNSGGATIDSNSYKGFEVYGNGVSDDATVNTGGYMLIRDGGTANGTVIEGGTVEVRFDQPEEENPDDGTTADGGSDPDAGITGDGSVSGDDGSDSGEGNTGGDGSGDTGDSGGSETTPTSSTVNNTVINNGGTLNVETGGIANMTEVNEGGVMNVNKGGEANSSTVNTGGTANINDGGNAYSTTVDGGTMNVKDSGSAASSTITKGGKIIASGTSMVSETAVLDGTLEVKDNATALNTTVSGNGMLEASQAQEAITGLAVTDTGSYHLTTNNNVQNADLYGKHYDTLFSNGAGTGIIVGGSSQLDVMSGGKLADTVLQHKGTVNVQNSGSINNTVANDSSNITIAAGASAVGTTLNGTSSMTVSGTAADTIVNSSGSTAAKGLEVNNGASVSNTSINGSGTVLLKNGSTANNTVMNGGVLTAENGAKLENLEIKGKAETAIDNGASLFGAVTVSGNATLGGSYDYGKIFSDAAINSLTVTEGVNAKFGNSLNATTAGKSLTFADGSYHISSNGDNGSTAVKGWEIVNIGGKDGTADVSLAGDLNLGSDDKTIQIGNGSTLDTSEVENIAITGSLVNAGDLNLVSAGNLADDKDNTTTISGNYTGQANSSITLKVDTLNGTTDKLVVNGDVSGTSELNVNITSAAKPTEKILFLEAPNDNSATGAHFTIWRVNTSPYLWDTSNEGHNWYMDMVNVGGKIGVYSETLAYMGLQSAGLEQTRSMVYNVINKINLRNNNLVDNRLMHSPQYRYYSKGIENYYNNYNFWAMPIYHTITNDSGVNYEADIVGGEAGIDLYNNNNNKAGVFVSYRQGNYKFDGKADKFFARYGSEIDIDSYSGGVYYRHNWQDAWALAMVYGGIQEADIKTKDNVSSDSDATEFGASIAAGYVYNMNYSFNIEPSAVISFRSLSYDDAKDIYGKTAEFDTLTLLEADLGVKFENTWNLDSGYAKAYIRPSLLFNSVSGDEVTITNFLDKSPEIDDGAYARLEIGGSADLSKFFSMYSTVRATAGSDYQDLAVTAGLNYVF